MQTNNTISIVIPTHKRPEGLKKLLQSIVNQKIDHQQVQVIVVSNFGDKKSLNVINEFSKKLYDLKYYVSGQKGCNIARNFGIRFSSCDIVYFVDDDCVLNSPDQLVKMIQYHNNFPKATGIGGGYLDRKDKLNAAEIIYSKNANLWLKKSANEKKETHHLIGGNASYKRKIFERGYNYNSQITFGGSEVSLTKRLYDHGFQLLFFEELSILHDLHVSPFAILKKGFMQGKGKLLNSSDHEADVFASHIKSIVPQKNNSVELQSTYQKLIWFLFHLMFKFGFHWNYYYRKNNLKSGRVVGAFGPIQFLGKYFQLRFQNRNRKIKVEYKKHSNQLYWLSVRWSNFTKRISKLTGIKAYWYTHAFFNFFYLRLKRIYFFSRRNFRSIKLFFKVRKIRFHHFIKARSQKIYWPLRRIYRYIAIVIVYANFKYLLAKVRKVYKFLSNLLIKKPLKSIQAWTSGIIFYVNRSVKKIFQNIYYKTNKYVLKPVYWLPNKISRKTRLSFYKLRKLVLFCYYKVNKYIVRRIYWLPGKLMRSCRLSYFKLRKYFFKFYFGLNKYVIRRIYWLPGKTMKNLRLIYYKTNKYVIRRIYWLPGKTLRLVRLSYYKFNKYVVRRIYWFPGKFQRFCYKHSRKLKYFGIKAFWKTYSFYRSILHLFNKMYWKLYSFSWTVRGFFHSLRWQLTALFSSIPRWTQFLLCELKNKLFAGSGLYWKIHPLIFKPYYFIKFQLNKRFRKKQFSKSGS